MMCNTDLLIELVNSAGGVCRYSSISAASDLAVCGARGRQNAS